jgi:hypothetical protein
MKCKPRCLKRMSDPHKSTTRRRATLGNDTARCDGVGSDAEGWREGCEDCLRRTAPRYGILTMTSPPPVIAFWCELHIPEVIYE